MCLVNNSIRSLNYHYGTYKVQVTNIDLNSPLYALDRLQRGQRLEWRRLQTTSIILLHYVLLTR